MPRRFKFNLAPVLSVRRIDEDKRKRAFGTTPESTLNGLHLRHLRLEEGWRVGLDRRLRRASAELVKRLQVREARRGEFVEARKKVRVLEQLRERRLTEHRRGVDREEQKISDENAITTHRRKEAS